MGIINYERDTGRFCSFFNSVFYSYLVKFVRYTCGPDHKNNCVTCFAYPSTRRNFQPLALQKKIQIFITVFNNAYYTAACDLDRWFL